MPPKAVGVGEMLFPDDGEEIAVILPRGALARTGQELAAQ